MPGILNTKGTSSRNEETIKNVSALSIYKIKFKPVKSMADRVSLESNIKFKDSLENPGLEFTPSSHSLKYGNNSSSETVEYNIT